MARNRETKIELTAYDDLFQTDESRAEAALSKIRDIPLSEIDEFPDHPFKVLMDEDKAKQGCYTDESSATEYAADRLSYGADRIKDEGIHQFNKQGQKAVKETRENIGKAKDKY